MARDELTLGCPQVALPCGFECADRGGALGLSARMNAVVARRPKPVD